MNSTIFSCRHMIAAFTTLCMASSPSVGDDLQGGATDEPERTRHVNELRGRVTAKATGEPVPGVIVAVVEAGQGYVIWNGDDDVRTRSLDERAFLIFPKLKYAVKC